MTSKIRSLRDLDDCPETFGYRGEALASIREVCRSLHIATRSSSSLATYEKSFTEGKASSISTSEEVRACPGMTVTVNDFLYNIPVRRKKVNEHFDSEEIRTQLEYIALVNPNVSLSLKNNVTGKVLLEVRKCNSTKDIFGQIYGPVLADQLKNVKFNVDADFSVQGYISLKGHYNRSFQFVFVNCR
jgi:DNA mismatch repair protein MLH3